MVDTVLSTIENPNVYGDGFEPDSRGWPYTHSDGLNPVSLVAAAVKQHYQITLCPECQGALIHAKKSLATRCVRCGHRTADPSRVVFAADDAGKRWRATHGRLTITDIINDDAAEGKRQARVSFRRCELCKVQNMTGRSTNMGYCAKCGKLSSRERAKRLRWRQEREASHTVQ